ncbi:MAG: Holliday junction branch migration protein RuvA [Clostridiales bacterium]|jgi:Holliday junction DNA helicase RuvA|nr:Holliday junction branch migration protein RuvA [Clostridiales bacterium]
MYSYIKGKVTEKNIDGIVVETGGIGYEILVSPNTSSRLTVGADAVVYTYYQVKQDGVALLGFQNRDEKNMFLRLITVSGIGPKNALAILGDITPYDLACAIAKNDAVLLSKVKGIGKKTAARIILELKEKITLEDQEAVLDAAVTESGAGSDASVALQALGFSKNDALKALKKAAENGASTTEDLIRVALKLMR